MARKRGKRTTQIVVYTFSAIVALSMILSLVGPILLREPRQPTPTWPPTWTLVPTVTTAPTRTPTAVPVDPTETPIVGPPAPVAGPAAPLVFAVTGDSRGGDDVYRQILERVAQDGSTFLINTGDLVNYGNQKNFAAFQDLMADFPLPFYPVPGNHDTDDDGTLAHYLSYSGAPATHYSFDAGPVRLVMANSASARLSTEELAWIDRELAATDQPVKMVVLHHPSFDPDGTSHILRSGNEAFTALMQKHGVDYVWAGHIHAYSQAERDGTTYVITGGGGARLYTQDHPDAFYHYIRVTVDGTQVSTQVVRIE